MLDSGPRFAFNTPLKMTSLIKLISPLSPLRGIFDLLWVGSFVAVLVLLFMKPSVGMDGGAGLSLELKTGSQTQGIYRRDKRLGTARFSIKRRGEGWLLQNTFQIKGTRAASIRLVLRQDLSLDQIELDADLASLGELMGGMGIIREALAGETALKLKGRCDLESGICAIKGKVGGKRLELPIAAGRGPVVTAAIYPLLVSGKLGNQVEVNLLDPLSMNLKQVTFTISGRESLKLGGRTFQSVRVQRVLDGFVSRIWLDETGMILKEEMPLGFSLHHESWSDAP